MEVMFVSIEGIEKTMMIEICMMKCRIYGEGDADLVTCLRKI